MLILQEEEAQSLYLHQDPHLALGQDHWDDFKTGVKVSSSLSHLQYVIASPVKTTTTKFHPKACSCACRLTIWNSRSNLELPRFRGDEDDLCTSAPVQEFSIALGQVFPTCFVLQPGTLLFLCWVSSVFTGFWKLAVVWQLFTFCSLWKPTSDAEVPSKKTSLSGSRRNWSQGEPHQLVIFSLWSGFWQKPLTFSWCISTLLTQGKSTEHMSIPNVSRAIMLAGERSLHVATTWNATCSPATASLGKTRKGMQTRWTFQHSELNFKRKGPRTFRPSTFASLCFWSVLETIWPRFYSLLLVGWLALTLVRRRTEKSSGKVQDVTENWAGESGVGWSPLCQSARVLEGCGQEMALLSQWGGLCSMTHPPTTDTPWGTDTEETKKSL